MRAYIYCSNGVLKLLPWFLNFHKVSLIDQCLSRGSQTMAGRGQSLFTHFCRVHSLEWDLFLPITQCPSWLDSSWVPWYIALNLTTPTKALLSVDKCQIVVVEWYISLRCLFGPCFWCLSFAPYFLKFSQFVVASWRLRNPRILCL